MSERSQQHAGGAYVSAREVAARAVMSALQWLKLNNQIYTAEFEYNGGDRPLGLVWSPGGVRRYISVFIDSAYIEDGRIGLRFTVGIAAWREGDPTLNIKTDPSTTVSRDELLSRSDLDSLLHTLLQQVYVTVARWTEDDF